MHRPLALQIPCFHRPASHLRRAIPSLFAAALILCATLAPAAAGQRQDGEQGILKPTLYVLAVGVSRYDMTDLRLQFAEKDARDVAAAFGRQKQLFRDVIVKILPNASRAELLEGLEWLRDEATSHDVTAFFFAGQGVNDRDNDFYFLPREANPAKLRLSAVLYLELTKTLSALPGKKWAFLDTCRAGNHTANRGPCEIDAMVNSLASAKDCVVFTSSSEPQLSLEDGAWNNGAFAKALVEGLDGQADLSRDGIVTIAEMEVWLGERVKTITGNRQTPTITRHPSAPRSMPIAVTR